MSKQDRPARGGYEKGGREKEREKGRAREMIVELYQEEQSRGRSRSERAQGGRGRDPCAPFFSPLRVAVGARQGCVGFGYLVSPLGPPLLPPLAAATAAMEAAEVAEVAEVAAAAAAAAAVHSISHLHPRQQPLSLPSVFLSPPPSRRRSPFALTLSHSLSLSAVSFSLPHASARCFSFF